MSGHTVFVLFIYFGLPIGLSLMFFKAGVIEIVTAYILWVAILLVGSILIGSRTGAEIVGWAMIFGIFFTAPAIPILVGICRLAGFSFRGFA